MLVSGQNGLICEHCIEQAHAFVKDNIQKEEFSPISTLSELKKPREIKKTLDEYVIGQDQAKNNFPSQSITIIKDFFTLQQKRQ